MFDFHEKKSNLHGYGLLFMIQFTHKKKSEDKFKD